MLCSKLGATGVKSTTAIGDTSNTIQTKSLGKSKGKSIKFIGSKSINSIKSFISNKSMKKQNVSDFFF